MTLAFETLSEDLHKQAGYAFSHDHAKTVDKYHGRIGVCQARTISDADLIPHLHTDAD